MKTTDKTKAVFLIHRENKEVFCLFPDMIENYNIPCFGIYAHIGQHGSCTIGYIEECCFALEREYKELKNELINLVGYDLQVFNEDEISWDYSTWINGKLQGFTEERAEARKEYWIKRKDKTYKADYEIFIMCEELKQSIPLPF